MDSANTSVDVAPVSGGEGAMPPASSSAGIETNAAQPVEQPVASVAQEPEVSGGEAVAPASEDEFPDEAAFQQLAGEERKSNWQRARTRIGELNTQLREAQEKAAIAAQIEELGGLETLKSEAELARSLFSYQTDENGQPIVDPNTGMPYLTTLPGLSRLQQESPDAFYTMLWEGTEMPLADGQTVGDWLLQQKFGLNPALLDTYKQIQSPQDALRYAPQAVHPDELANVPDEFHEAYKSFDATDREALQDLAFTDESRFLARLRERNENLEAQKFIQEARAKAERDEQARQQQWEQGIHQRTMDFISQKREQTINAQLDRLKTQFQPFGPDSPGNQLVYDSILNAAERVVENPAVAQKAESAANFYYQAERYAATGNQLLASQARAKADALTLDVQREYAKAATEAVNQWNTYLKGRIVAAQPSTQPVANAATPQNQSQQPAASKEPGRFGLTPDRINQIAAQLAMQKAGA